MSMLDLLDKLDSQYNRINNLGRWSKKEDPHLLGLTASLQSLQSQFTYLSTKYQALVATKDKPTTPNPTAPTKLSKPPPKKATDREITEFKGRAWKWCNKCFGGSWNRMHINKEHQPGKGRSKNKHTPPSNDDVKPPPASSPSPIPSASSDLTSNNEANVATTSDFDLDFL